MTRVVIKFDLPVIPAGATVTRADLSLYCFRDDYPATGVLFHLFRMTRPWKETEVTWYNSDADSIWDNAGGDYYPGMVDQQQMDLDVGGTWQTFNTVTAVQRFVDEPDSNFGMIISQGAGSEYLYFYSSETPHDTLRPKLTISYTTDTNSITDIHTIPAGYSGDIFYPVRVAEGILFQVRLPEGKGYRLSVYDISGRKTWSYARASGYERTIWSFPESTVRRGVYLAVLTSGNLKISKSLLIQP